MDTKKSLTLVKQELLKKIDVEKVYLFGSRVRKDFHKFSDYDIAILSKDFEGMSYIDRQMLVRPLIRKVLGEVPLDTICYTPKEFKIHSAFIELIEEEGVAV